MPANYYDMVLLSIPLLLFGIGGSLIIAGLSVTTAIPIASILAIVIIGHSLFLNPPQDSFNTETAGPLAHIVVEV